MYISATKSWPRLKRLSIYESSAGHAVMYLGNHRLDGDHGVFRVVGDHGIFRVGENRDITLHKSCIGKMLME